MEHNPRWKFNSLKEGNPDSGIREMFGCGIRKLGNFHLWNPDSWAL